MRDIDNHSACARTVVVTGGSGYIGSTIVYTLTSIGYVIIVIDKQVLPPSLRNNLAVIFVQGDYSDPKIWAEITARYTVDAVIHLAAYIEVGESVRSPAAYYENNVRRCISMMNILKDAEIRVVIAASSSAVYGNPLAYPISEKHQRAPLSPYGRTKMMLEDISLDYHAAYGFHVALLRFANVAGALPEQGLGECHDPETHLIPRVIAALATRAPFQVHGHDYPTPDGTCLRDFVHVYDVACLHSVILHVFFTSCSPQALVLNVGSGTATSVKEVIARASSIMNVPIIIEEHERRPGDTAIIVLDINAAYEAVGWKPVRSDIQSILESAIKFQVSS